MINIVIFVAVELLMLKSLDSTLNCGDGYFPLNDTCVHCSVTCVVCTSEYNCTVCKNGFKGITCSEECVNCKPGTPCDRIEGYCYLGCKDGLGGSQCNRSCNPNCKNCYRDDTNKCETCAPNRYGRECEFPCPINCYQQMCDHRDGHCQNGCIEGYWRGKCDDECPRRCKHKVCNIDNGTCTKGCVDNYEGNKCLCPLGCSCDTKGYCIFCTAESGIVCDERCSDGCVGKFCRNETSVCWEGCIDGYSGGTCNKVEKNAENSTTWLAVLLIVPVVLIGYIICKRCRRRSGGTNNPTSVGGGERTVVHYNCQTKTVQTEKDYQLKKAAKISEDLTEEEKKLLGKDKNIEASPTSSMKNGQKDGSSKTEETEEEGTPVDPPEYFSVKTKKTFICC